MESFYEINHPCNLQQFQYGGKRIITLARPAYDETDLWEKEKIMPKSDDPIWESIDPIIEKELACLKNLGVTQLISFSNDFFNRFVDSRIREIWAKTSPEASFSSILTEDHCKEVGTEDDGDLDGIVPEKLKLFYLLTLQETSPVTAVYCGAGLGRSGGYVTGWAAKQNITITSERRFEKRLELIKTLVQEELACQYKKTKSCLRTVWASEVLENGSTEAVAASLE